MLIRHAFLAAAGVVVAVAVAAPARGQGNGKGQGQGQGHGHAPSNSPLPSPAVVAPATAGAVPFAWIDDASVVPPGTIAASISAMRWQGPGLSEVYAPVFGLAAGWVPRLQIGASIPRVVGDDVNGVVGGVGTSYVTAKIGVLTGGPSGVKVAAAPTLEILGSGALESLASGTSRTQFGLPISLEVDRRTARMFASAGYFTQGVWFAGGGIGVQASPRVGVSAAFSRAWTPHPLAGAVGDRRELSGSLAFSPRPGLALFGSLGQTIATSDADGAGTTLTCGVMLARTSSPVHRPR